MDVDRTLRQLYLEKKRLDWLISRLESRVAADGSEPKRSARGRKSMGTEERLEVSARMTAYWAARRAQQASTEHENPQPSQEDFVQEANA